MKTLSLVFGKKVVVIFVLAVLPMLVQAQYQLEKAFAFGADTWTRAVPNQPSINYTKVGSSNLNSIKYDSLRGWGYTNLVRIDSTANNRGVLSGPDEIYDQFIGAKGAIGSSIKFRVNLPNGTYRFVAAGGDALSGPHPTSVLVKNGSSATQSYLVFKVSPINNQFWRVGFDSLHAPTGDGSGTQPNFLPEVSSTSLVVSQGFIEVEQIVDSGAILAGGDLCLMEFWRQQATTTRPTITSEPLDTLVTSGQTARFVVSVIGSSPLQYAWKKNNTALPCSGSVCSFVTVQSDSGARISVIVSNSVGADTSRQAILTVIRVPSPVRPVISSEPRDTSVTAGQPVSFSVYATGTNPLRYAWKKNNTALPCSGSVCSFVTVQSDSGARISVIVSNSVGADTSRQAILTVRRIQPNPIINTRPVLLTGELFDALGNPIGTIASPVLTDMVIRLFASETDSLALYTENFVSTDTLAIPVMDGIFTIKLGKGRSNQSLIEVLAKNPSLFAEIQVGVSDPDILSPRTQLANSPYSFSSASTPIRRAGDPNTFNVQAQLGSWYVDTSVNSTWIKTNSTWVRLNP